MKVVTYILIKSTAYKRHAETLKLNICGVNNKKWVKFDCVTCKTSLSQYSVDQHLKIKMHPDNVNGITIEKINKDTSGYCDICSSRYNNKKKHKDSDWHEENDNQKKVVDGKWRDKINELGSEHNMKYNQKMKSSSIFEDPRFLEALEALYKLHPHIKFNTFDVVRYTKPTDEQIEEKDITVGLRTRQYNRSYDLDLVNGEFETRMQIREMNQSGCIVQRFVKRTMYIHRFYPGGGCAFELTSTSRYILNIQYTDNKCLLWCLIAYLHPAKDHPNRVSNYNKPEYINEI